MSYKDVRATISKKDSACKGCKKQIKAGMPIVINPKTKEVWCIQCGKTKIQ